MSANNPYAGFAPGTANLFRKMVGLPEAAWGKGKNQKDEDEGKSDLHSSDKGRVQILRHKVISQYVNILQLVF